MNKAQKVEMVQKLSDIFSSSGFILVAYNRGMSVSQMSKVRQRAKEIDCGYMVTKNRLAKIALKDSKYEKLLDVFSGPTSIAYSSDPVTASKMVVEFEKEYEGVIEVAGGMMRSEDFLEPSKIKIMSKLPSLDEIRGKIACLLSTPASRVASVLQASARDMIGVLQAYSKK